MRIASPNPSVKPEPLQVTVGGWNDRNDPGGVNRGLSGLRLDGLRGDNLRIFQQFTRGGMGQGLLRSMQERPPSTPARPPAARPMRPPGMPQRPGPMRPDLPTAPFPGIAGPQQPALYGSLNGVGPEGGFENRLEGILGMMPQF